MKKSKGKIIMNQDYYDEYEDLEDNYHPIFDFRKSKWLYDRLNENKRMANSNES